METVAPPPASQAAHPALAQVFALGLAACSLAAGLLAEVEPATVLLRAAVAYAVGRLVGKGFCALSASLTVPPMGRAPDAPAEDAPAEAA